MLRTLADKVRPQHTAVLIVDVQNDFCAEGGVMQREGRDLKLVQEMVPRLAQFVIAARAAKVPLVWIRNVYNTGPNWYLSDIWLEQAERRHQRVHARLGSTMGGAYLTIPVCEPNAWSGDFYEIKPLPEDVIVTKHRYGAFESTDLDLVLRSQGIRTVIMTGVATNVCVETTARQAFMRDYYVVFSNDCTAAYSQAEHDATLHNIDSFFGQVASSAEIQAGWQQAPVRLRAVT